MKWLLMGVVSVLYLEGGKLSADASAMEYLVVEQQRPRSRPPEIRRPPPRRPLERLPQTRPNPNDRQAMLRYSQMMEQRRERAQQMVQRVRESQSNKRKYERLNRKLQQEYGLSFVPLDNRIVLVRYREVVGVNLSDDSRKLLEKLGFRPLRQTQLGSLRLKMTLLLAPEGMETPSALQVLREKDPSVQYRYNIAYAPAGAVDVHMVGKKTLPETGTGLTPSNSIGMIDTGVRADHKQLKKLAIKQQNIGRGKGVTPRNHGTAVASIMALDGNPNIYVADVFSGPVAFADAEAIVVALNWLADHKVPIINISLAGPHSDLLQYAVKTLVDRGHILVAAVGNNGPEGEPLYPASYRGVIGVTAIDENHEIYGSAYQGPAVTVASYGVKVRAASLKGRKKYSGTSFAAPMVSRYLLPIHTELSKASALNSVKQLLNTAEDYGEKGYDRVFGFGVILK